MLVAGEGARWGGLVVMSEEFGGEGGCVFTMFYEICTVAFDREVVMLSLVTTTY